ncbi:MAG: 50S ribosomal protein L16 [Rhodothermaceae bacterium]|jgi:large subunit ribosomal protein L16|nr:50S ribosomal protein L16 [Rhodothermaceae bacterium]
MLEPKRVERRRVHRGTFRKVSNRGHQLAFGDFGLKSLEPKFITARQIEACRVAISRKMSREGQIWIRIFPDKPRTKKPAETRMGSGKGALDHFAAVVEPGRIMFEVAGVPLALAKEALRLAQFKLPVKTKIVVRRDYEGV